MKRYWKRRRAGGLLPYFAAAGITDPTEIAAATTLINSLKSNNFWDRLDRIFPFSPTSLNAASYCCKTFTQLTWFNSPTHSSSGVAFDGVSQYAQPAENADTYTNYSALGSVGIYLQATTGLSGIRYLYGFSGLDSSDLTAVCYLLYRQGTTAINAVQGTPAQASQSAILTVAFQHVSRTSVSSLVRYRNGVSVSSSASIQAPSSIPINLPINLMSLNSSGSPSNYFEGRVAFWVIGDDFNATDSLTLYNIIQTYQTALSRSV